MNMLRKCLPSVVLGVSIASAALADSSVEWVKDGKQQTLLGLVSARVADRLAALFDQCSLNSRDYSHIFAEPGPDRLWTDTLAQDHLLVRFAVPVRIRAQSSVVVADRLLLGLGDPKFPGPTVAHSGATIVAFTKCNGGTMIEFVCDPQISEWVPASYRPLCRLLERQKGHK
jgi:hypothetical protein